MSNTRRILTAVLLTLLCITGAAARNQRNSELRVMSFNVRFDTPKDSADRAWPMRQRPIANMLADVQPDLVGIQEGKPDMLDSLYSIFKGYRHFDIKVGKKVGKKATGSNVIFYRPERFQVVDSGYFWLGPRPDTVCKPWNSTDQQVRSAVYLCLKDRQTGKRIYLLDTHFPYKKAPIDTDVRQQCAQLICQRIHQLFGDKAIVFVTGDMNSSDSPTDPRSPSLAPYFKYMKSARNEARFTNRRHSFNGFGKQFDDIKGLNLDHIFYRNATPVLFETVDYPGYGVQYISDHYPIMCTFEI